MAAPRSVPAGLWHSGELRAAFASRHMGHVIRAYRHHLAHGPRPLPQELVAGWMGITQAQLSRIENGPAIRDLDRLSAWATLLGMPRECLWFALPAADDEPPAAAPVVGRGPGPDVGTDAQLIGALRAADRRIGGASLYATVVGHLARHPYSPPAPQAPEAGPMVAAAASFSEMAGWMALDAGARTAAHRHLRRAVTLARNSGDRQLTAQAYASVSHLARSTGKAEAALTYAREGLACLAAAPPCGWLEARLRVVAASALAACGRPVEAVAAMSAAEAATATPSAAPSSWLSPFDAASFAIEAARCFARVDDPGEAERRLRTAVSLRGVDRVRSRALAQLALVTVLVGRGQIAEACALVEDVLDRAGGLGSAVLWDQLRHVSVLLDRDRAESTVVSPLVGRVEAAVHEHAWIAATAAWYETGTGAGVADAR